MTINKYRSIERAAVNAFISLAERHNFIVQEIDGGNDHGEDVYVSFTENMQRTGDTIFVQIKGGYSYKTTHGYRVPIEDHRKYWENSNAPVFCVVQDPDTQELFWENASLQLHEAKRLKKTIKSIKIGHKRILNDETINAFALRARLYIADTGDLHRFLTKISGVQFDITDYLAYFENLFGERMIFRQRENDDTATLLHSDLDWVPIPISDADIAYDKPALHFPQKGGAAKSLVRDVVLDKAEYTWIEACFEASEWIRNTNPDNEVQKNLNTHPVPPILYTPRQEQEVANKVWRQKPELADLMTKLNELSYAYWRDPDDFYVQKITSRGSMPSKEVLWNEMKDIVHQLRGIRVPTHYIIGNRGRLTRSEAQKLCQQEDYRS